MSSPFPGMDPYLERHWGDVHSRLIIYASDQLRMKLPRDLRARVQERVFVEAPAATGRSIFPDVRIVEKRSSTPAATCVETGIVVAEPLVVEVANEPEREGFIEIIDVSTGGRVVTSIEFLSPSNKLPGEGRNLYLKKQTELKEAGVNSVEIDLIRSGRQTFAIPPEWVPTTHRRSYGACVRRSTAPGRFELYTFPLRQPLPAIRIPLRSSDSDVVLELQPLVNLCYENGGYDSIDYKLPLDPPLDADDEAWAGDCVRHGAVRPVSEPDAP